MLNSQELREALEKIDAEMPRYGTDPMPTGPWLFAHDGAEWAIATNGHYMIGVPRVNVAGDLNPIPQKALGLATQWMPFVPTMFTPFSIGALRRFTRVEDPNRDCAACRNKRTVACDECHGAGERECECSACGDEHSGSCDVCDGKGIIACRNCRSRKPLNGGFLGHVLDTRYVAAILSIVANGDERDIHASYECCVSSKKKYDGYFFRSIGDGPQWAAILMPLASYVEADFSFEEPVTVNAGATTLAKGAPESA